MLISLNNWEQPLKGNVYSARIKFFTIEVDPILEGLCQPHSRFASFPSGNQLLKTRICFSGSIYPLLEGFRFPMKHTGSHTNLFPFVKKLA